MPTIILILLGILCVSCQQIPIQTDDSLTTEIRTRSGFSLDVEIPVVVIPQVNVEMLLEEDRLLDVENVLRPFRFGYAIDVEIDLKKEGVKIELPEGGNMWLLKIHSADAFSINLIYDHFKIGKGSKFYVYNEDKKMVLGAFTPEECNNPDNVFATDLVQGNTIVLEYYEPMPSEDGVIHIGKVIHGYIDTFDRGLDDSGSCNFDVICNSNWILERRAVTRILVDNNTSFCTGCLVNNTSRDGKPYILTANHCFYDANGNPKIGTSPTTSIFRFLYWKPNCGSGSPAGWQETTPVGATMLAHWANTDFALLELKTKPSISWNLHYAGWDRRNVIPTSTIGIHHPKGDAMKISSDNDPPTQMSYSLSGYGPVSCWRVVWNTGTTEQYSSGSPLFNESSHLIIGQLFGGTASCLDPSGHDNYGRLDLSWAGGGTNATRLSNWLDPLGSAPLTLEGMGGPTISSTSSILCPSPAGASVSVINAPPGFTWGKSSNINLSSNIGNPVAATAAGASGAGWISIMLGGAELGRLDVSVAGTIVSGEFVAGTGSWQPLYTVNHVPSSAGSVTVALDYPGTNTYSWSLVSSTGSVPWTSTADVLSFDMSSATAATFRVTVNRISPCTGSVTSDFNFIK